eukprot:scaffold28738_cov63-Attheya_sp.AAC.1
MGLIDAARPCSSHDGRLFGIRMAGCRDIILCILLYMLFYGAVWWLIVSFCVPMCATDASRSCGSNVGWFIGIGRLAHSWPRHLIFFNECSAIHFI